MNQLEKRVAGDWFEIKERVRHPDQLFELLYPTDRDDSRRLRSREALSGASRALENAIEGGVFEFRKTELLAVFGKLADAEYSSEVFGHLPELRLRCTALLFVSACQRALLAGDMRFIADSEKEHGPDTAKGIENKEINDIISEIKEIVASDPSAKMNPAIKNILLQVQKYREETETYRKLKEQANDQRLEMYSKTFSNTFHQIFESIRKNYAAYIEEKEAERRENRRAPVESMDTREWVRSITTHLEHVSRIRSTIAFAEEEHSGMRGPMVDLIKRRATILDQLDKEIAIAEKACGSSDERAKLSRALSVEIAERIKRFLDSD